MASSRARRSIARLGWVVAALLSTGTSRGDDARRAPEHDSHAGGSVHGKVTSEVGAYSDTNDVTVWTPAVSAGVERPTAGWSFDGSYLVDIVTAASVDIVSTASGPWTEKRHAGTLSASYKPGDVSVAVSGAISREPDYLSLNGGGTMSIELAKNTVTPSLSYAYTNDTAGRRGTPFSVYSLVLERHTLGAGVELVLDKATTLGLVSNVMLESGQQEKPYRYVPLFTPNVAPLLRPGTHINTVNDLRLPGKLSEEVPDSRTRVALSARLAHRWSAATFVMSERVYGDDWGMKASTTDLRVLMDAGRRFFIWTHLRAHVQTGVSFYQLAYVGLAGENGVSVPALRTGDRELGPLASGTFGGGLRCNVGASAHPDAWSLVLQPEVTMTNFQKALFIRTRQSYLAVLELEARL